MARYRITFSDGPTGNHCKHYDVEAKSSDAAFAQAFKMPEAKQRELYSDVSVEELPEENEPRVVGIKFAYYDTYAKRNFVGYMSIRAISDDQAIAYYNNHFKGNRFWFKAGLIEEDGKHVYGKVLDTYLAGTFGYQADATKE